MYPKIWLLCFSLIIQTYITMANSKNWDIEYDRRNEHSISTSVASMMELLETEEAMVLNLKNYAKALERKIKIIKSEIHRKRLELKKSEVDPEAYLSNPINAFSLIRRMQEDWTNWELYLREAIGHTLINEASDEPSKMPTETDLREAIAGLREIQTTYNLNSSDIAVGLLNGKQYESGFSSLDLYTIGYELLKQNASYEASAWLRLALQTYNASKFSDVLDFRKQKIYEVYSLALLKHDDFVNAARMLEEAILYDKTNAKLHQNMEEFENLYTKRVEQKEPIAHLQIHPSEFLGCNGEFLVRPHSLHCRYNTQTSDFLKLAPIKVEEISLDPYMVLYHDVIANSEIAHLKTLSHKKLERPILYNEERKRDEPISFRTGKNIRLGSKLSPVTRRLNQRIADMTGLETKGSEALQILNYGLGGHCKQHCDYFNVPVNDKIIRKQGNRKATVQFFLSDVEQGGATVFPHLKIAVFPQKGAALMWHNLNNRGDPDWRTLHAGCPVIVGSKWLATKWIREKNQFIKSPCVKELI